jgi:hypothetical protein
MTSSSSKREPISGEELEELLDELAVAIGTVKDLQLENAALKREVTSWQKRSDRAEMECLKWKTTAHEWRHEWMKRTRER